MKSNYDFAITVNRVDSLIKTHPPMQLITRIDYDISSQKADILLRPTTLIIFGNPEFYSLLVTCKQTLAIDLPQKVLVWQDDTAQVWVGYQSPPTINDQHGVNCKKVIQHMDEEIQDIAKKASGRFDNFTK
jgi:uncharacterized protein (DUF302 family)